MLLAHTSRHDGERVLCRVVAMAVAFSLMRIARCEWPFRFNWRMGADGQERKFVIQKFHVASGRSQAKQPLLAAASSVGECRDWPTGDGRCQPTSASARREHWLTNAV